MARGVTVKLKGVEQIQKHFDSVATDSNDKVRKAVTEGTSMVLDTAKSLCPTNKYTADATLRSSIKMQVSNEFGEIEGRVFTGVEYAAFVEFGTGEVGDGTYPYKPKGINLSYEHNHIPWVYTPDGGENFYSTRGYRARPFMYPALSQNKRRIRQRIAQAIKESARKK